MNVDPCRWAEAGLQLYPRAITNTFLWEVRMNGKTHSLVYDISVLPSFGYARCLHSGCSLVDIATLI